MKKIIFLSVVLLLFCGISGCSRDEDVKRIDLSQKIDVKAAQSQSSGPPLRIAVGGMITPKEGFSYYKQLLDYIGEKLGRKVEFVDREDYAEINALVKKRDVDVAFVCGGPYVDGHADFGMELLAAPVAYGGTVYYSYIIVSKDSPVDSLEGLRGKTFAFTDPLSNTGKLVPTYMLAKMNETPETFFKSFDYTHAHDKSIKAVATGVADGAAVDSLIWEYANRTNPEFTSRTKIIKKSPPYGIPPVAVHPDMEARLKESLRQIYLNAHNDGKGRGILKGMMVDKFVPIDDGAYDSIREMKQWIADIRTVKQ
ncbi:MAG: phosphate/phosphite/phosphonate ABC transporter substrate-binding protein [Nitrospirae bacterium]|nr:phosphate/phosphite/phosphonate ABC transporter substrate-binding protein [Nitrospirota bacterium]